MSDITTKADDELLQCQKQLEGEIQANEDESRAFQADLDKLYAEQDRRRN